MNTVIFPALVSVLLFLASCRESGSTVSGYQDSPEQWTCKELDAELAAKRDEKTSLERRIASECDSQRSDDARSDQTTEPAEKQESLVKKSDSTPKAGGKKSSLALQSGVTYNSEGDRSRVCEGNKAHAENLGSYVTRLQGIYDGKDCKNAAADSRTIYDRAECLQPCANGRCFTCKYEGSGIGAGFASCSSEADASQAALRVCNDLAGQRCRIDSCYIAEAITSNRPTAVGDKGDAEVAASWSSTATASVSYGAASAEAQFQAEGTFTVQVAGGRDSLGTGIREGQVVGDDSPDATWTCTGSGKITGLVSVSAGFSIVGNGMSMEAAYERSQRSGLTHGPFRAAGLTVGYMERECRSWATEVALPDLVKRQAQLFKIDRPVFADCRQDGSLIGCPCEPTVANSCASNVVYPPETPVMCMQSSKGYYACERVFAKGQGNCLRTQFRMRCAPGSSCVQTQAAGYFSEAVGICQ